MKEKIRNILDNAYFIGGSPCSGKSTISEVLVEEYDFNHYKIDDYEMEHIEQATSDKEPTMYNYLQMNWDERLMRSPEKQAKELFDFYQERFNMILSDLEQFSEDIPVILEGAALLPKRLDKIEIKKNKIIYLVPSKEFQVKHYSERSWIKDILSECKDSEKAFENWMERDYQFGKLIINQAEKLEHKVIYVDGEKTIEQNIKKVEKHFELK
ncbi:MAG: hypothetical protein ACOC1K_05910 [Nanoarchaeota archaeon]